MCVHTHIYRKRELLKACKRTMSLNCFIIRSQQVQEPSKSFSKNLFWNMGFQYSKYQAISSKLTASSICLLPFSVCYAQNETEVLSSEELGVNLSTLSLVYM